MNPPLSYKPSAAYYRRALRALRTRQQAVALGLKLVGELERHKEFIREQGLIPPKWFIMQAERDEKQWGLVLAVDFVTAARLPLPDQPAAAATISE